MRKFKHKISGDIVDSIEKHNMYMCGTKYSIPTYIVENSNDWEEIKETKEAKSYEILEFSDGVNKYYKTSTGDFTINLQYTYKEKDLLTKRSDYFITKVKRLKDGEIFSVRQEVYSPIDSYCAIYSFGIHNNNELIVECTHSYLLGNMGLNVFNVISNKKKETKSPILTTFDGKEVYEKESFYNLNTKEWTYSLLTASQLYTGPYPTDTVRFASKEKMLEYIEENKPKFSKKQILETLECKGTSYCEINIWKAFFKERLKL